MKNALTLLLLLSLFLCCKKSKVVDTNVVAPNSGVLLQKLIIRGPLSTNGGEVQYFQHDVNGRLVNILDSANAGAGIMVTNTPFAYSASGMLSQYGQIAPTLSSIQLTYDSNNVLTGGTSQSFNPNSLFPYSHSFKCTITNDQVSQAVVTDLRSGAQTTFLQTYDDNGNIIKRVILNSAGVVVETYTYTYGTHYSPQYTNHLKYNIGFLFPFTGQDDYFNTNEMLTENLNGIIFECIYTYNQQYPLSKIELQPPSNYQVAYWYTYSGL